MSGGERRPEETVSRLVRSYHEPPETPAEEMWGAVREDLTARGLLDGPADGGPADDEGTSLRARRAARRWPSRIGPAGWIAAAAALLVLGIGVGRWSAPEADGPPPPGRVAVPSTAAPDGGALRVAAGEHLSASEAFLTLVRADARAGRLEPGVGRWAETLLAQTRVLMDTPAADDPEVAALLGDLELLLVQVIQAAGTQGGGEEWSRQELELLTRGLESTDMTLRIEAVLPLAPGSTGT